MTAIDLAPDAEGLREALAVAVRRVLATEPGARLACVNVLKTSLHRARSRRRQARPQSASATAGRAQALGARAAGRARAHHLSRVRGRPITASALVDYARHNRIDHIIIGARGSSPLRRYLGSVSAKVVAEAPCTVTVVRPRDVPAPPELSPDSASAGLPSWRFAHGASLFAVALAGDLTLDWRQCRASRRIRPSSITSAVAQSRAAHRRRAARHPAAALHRHEEHAGRARAPVRSRPARVLALSRVRGRPRLSARARGAARLSRRRLVLGRHDRHQLALDRHRDRQPGPRFRLPGISRRADRAP